MGKEKSKAFFYEGTWYHRTKFLRDDFSVGYSKKGGFATEKEALESYEQMNKEFENQRKALSVKNVSSITLADYLNYWFYQVKVPEISSATRNVWEIVLSETLLPNIASIKLSNCTTDYFDSLLEKASVYSKSAGNKAREFLFNAMRTAVSDGYLGNNPIEGTKPYPRGKPKITILTKEELKKLMVAMVQSTWMLETMLALFCGLRKGEIYGLKFGDFDVEERTVTVSRQVTQEYFFDENGKRVAQEPTEKPPKTENSYRTLRVPLVILGELKRRRLEIEQDKEKLGDGYEDHDYICCQENGKSCSMSAFNLALERACQRSGVRKITVHSLRHIYATVLLEYGVSLAKISALLGHSSIHTTFEYYCEVIDERESIKTYLNDTFAVESEEDEYGD